MNNCSSYSIRERSIMEKTTEYDREAKNPSSSSTTTRHSGLKQAASPERTLLDAVSDPVFLIDSEGAILWANCAFANQFEKNGSSVIGRNAFEMAATDECPFEMAESFMREALRSGRPSIFEFVGDGYLGKQICRPVFDESGKVVQAAVLLKLSPWTQRASVVSTLMDSVDAGVWAIDRKYRLTACNSLFLETLSERLGIEIELGDSVLFSRVPQRTLDKWKGYYNRAFSGERFSIESESPLIRPYGYVEFGFAPIRLDNGAVVGAVVSARDVTRRIKAEKLLEKRERNCRILFQACGDHVFILDSRGFFLVSNRFADMVDSPPESSVGKVSIEDFFPEDYAADFREKFIMAAAGRPIIFEQEATGKNECRLFLHTLFPVYRDGQVAAVAGSTKDVTESTRVRDQLYKTDRLLATLLDAIPIMVVRYEPGPAAELHVNKAFENISGWPAKSAACRDFLKKCFPGATERRAALELLRSPSQEWTQVSIIDKSGKKVGCSWTASMLDGGAVLFFGMENGKLGTAEVFFSFGVPFPPLNAGKKGPPPENDIENAARYGP